MDTLTRLKLLGKICDRAIESGLSNDRMTLILDLEYAKDGKNKPPEGRKGNLNLEVLLNEEPLDFNHDILGISNHINRADTDTMKRGEMRDCFVPRCGFVNEKGE
jgi:hypothetical protein